MTFPVFYSLPRTRNINYNIQNMQHFFTFLAPRNLNRTTLELFFSLNQRLSIRPFGRRVYESAHDIMVLIVSPSNEGSGESDSPENFPLVYTKNGCIDEDLDQPRYPPVLCN